MKFFIHENAFENVACKIAAILPRCGWGGGELPNVCGLLADSRGSLLLIYSIHHCSKSFVVVHFVFITSSVFCKRVCLVYQHSSGLIQRQRDDHRIAHVPVKYSWRRWAKLYIYLAETEPARTKHIICFRCDVQLFDNYTGIISRMYDVDCECIV